MVSERRDCFGEYKMNNKICLLCEIAEKCYDEREYRIEREEDL